MPIEKNYTFLDHNKKVTIRSSSPFHVVGIEHSPEQLKYSEADTELYKSFKKIRVAGQKLRIAYVCNWGQHCGISTYSKYVHDELAGLTSEIDEIAIFSEHPISSQSGQDSQGDINYCFKRGQPLDNLLTQILAFSPDFVLIQHEWGVFPDARYLMNFLLSLKRFELSYTVVMHSVWDHADKSLVTAIMENVVVHSKEAAECLQRNGYKNGLHVIPHGCPEPRPMGYELWNNMKTPYSVFGFGFGFKYKGVETAIRAVHHLVTTYPQKYGEMLYVYHCSESENNKGLHDQYVAGLHELVDELGISNNIILMSGYLDDVHLDKWLRTTKMAIFPYVIDEDGVYGSSGAIKIAMSYHIPVIASKSRLFDDIEGYVVRVEDPIKLALEMGKNFSSADYRSRTIGSAHKYITENSWPNTGIRYISAIREIWEN